MMNFFRNLLSKAALSVAKNIAFMPVWARYAFTSISFDKLVSEGYKKNSAVSACATTLQLTFPEPPLLYGYEEEGRFIPDYNHPIMELLRNPNDDMGMAEFLQFVITYASVGGNAYIWKQRSLSGKVIKLWIYSDADITPVGGLDTSEGIVAYYELNIGDGNKTIIPKKDMIQWKWMIDPQFPWRGIGAIALSAREVDRDNEATSYIFSLLKNNAVPPIVVKLEDGDDSTQEEIDAMGQKWRQKHSHGEPAFISAGMSVQEMGFDLHKLAAEALADVPETRIAANFHVPPSVAGLNVGVKRSDYGDTAARKAFTEQTLMALWRSFASEMHNGLKDDFNVRPNSTLKFDVQNVGALQELKKDQRTSVNELWKSGLFTRAEAKSELGMKPLPSDNVYFVSLASEFIPANGSGTITRNDPSIAKGLQLGRKSAVNNVLLRIRTVAAGQMKTAVDVYFSQLADRVVDRVREGKRKAEVKADLPNANDLVNGDDRKQLENLIKRYYVQVIELSWDTWNVSLGIEKAFDLTDPAVTRALKMAGSHVKEIQGTVLDAMKDALKYASENGWGIDQLVRGDENQRGLRDIIDETYKNQSRAIARAELGQAQNAAAAERYRSAGLEKVEILDGGAEDSAPACQLANGQIWTVDLFDQHRLQHPNCSRCGAPYFGDEDAVTSWPYEFGDRG
jgi:HK97 family phage portal protein